MGFSANELASHTHNFAKQFVEKYYPDEAVYFPLIWEKFLQQGKEIVSRKRKGFWTSLGLPFAAERVGLVSPFVILTIKAVLAESGSFGRTPGLVQFKEAVKSAAKAFNGDPSLVAQLENKLAPELFDLFQNLAEAQPSKKDLLSDQSELAPHGHVYADWLFNKEYRTAQQITNAERDALIQKKVPRCTFAVDETNGPLQLWIAGALCHNKKLDKVPAMLWLAMTHVGTKIPFKKVRDLFGLSLTASNEVYLPRNQLKRFFDNKWNEGVMEESQGTERYSVAEKGWSFYWFHLDKNPRSSELVHQQKKKGHLTGFNLLYYEQAMQAHQSFSGSPRENQ